VPPLLSGDTTSNLGSDILVMRMQVESRESRIRSIEDLKYDSRASAFHKSARGRCGIRTRTPRRGTKVQ
jgi:hypothetical protein